MGHASREDIRWNWDGNWPTCCCYLCVRDFTSFCKGYFWELHTNFYVSWTYGVSLYWTPCQGYSGLVASLFLGIYCSCCCASCLHGVLCRESSVAFQASREKVHFLFVLQMGDVSAHYYSLGQLASLCSFSWFFSPICIHAFWVILSKDYKNFHQLLTLQYLRGRGTEAEAEFEKLLGAAHVKFAMAELSKSDRGDELETVKFSELLYGRHFKMVFIGSTIFALQQLSGINAVFYFSSTVFKSFGVPSDLANTCVGIANLSGSILAMILMDKLGRKVLLLGSFSGMAVAMGLQVTGASSYTSGSGALSLSVGGMLLFVLMFALGAGPVPGLLLSEILPSRIRAKAMAVCMAVHWVINFFVGLLFLPLLEQIGPQILYTVFATFCLLAVVFVKRNVIETKGKSLQEIEIALIPPQ
ncbi:probable plastidic glucose transporter 2 isoform X4 [Pyrus x bretschneideri]|uniref:probable plastidic glucose transporter 2 isoform X4 n=1 Tax=Pyrus x bretschneideri TaxID=225117 RepID=UPI00203081A4|nr:probable plastidic glucose transporter 2 isoform X4 [Pyrus x bretschneideri]